MARQFGTTKTAKDGVVDMLQRDIRLGTLDIQFDATSPDGDVAKFTINNKIARAIHLFSGYYLPINNDWFSDADSLPMIKGTEFYYYVFAIEPKLTFGVNESHYFITDYLQIKDWVLEFNASTVANRRDQKTWMANIRPYDDGSAYFRWGDEPVHSDRPLASRWVELDNIKQLLFGGDNEQSQSIEASTIEMSDLEWFEQANAAITGEKAEKHFMSWIRDTHPEWGDPIDRTGSVGLGYDIEFLNSDIKVEVKGCRGNIDNLRMTKREWYKARDMGELYCLAIVSQLDANPKVNLIFDPYGNLQRVNEQERMQITYMIPHTSVISHINSFG